MDYTKLKAKDAEVRADHHDWTDQQVCDSLNAATVPRNRTSMTGSEVVNAVDAAEYAALTADKKEAFWNVVHLGTLNPFGVEATLLVAVFGAESATIAALASARVELVSWATSEGYGFLYPGHLENARMA